MITRLVCLFILASISFNSYSNSKVTLAVENSWPPYSNNQGNGLSKEIIKKAYHAVNVEVEFIVVPYARALHMVKVGSADGAFNVTKQANTESIFNFGEEPLLQATASFYYNNDSDLDFSSASDIPDRTTIALILGYEYGDAFQQNKHRFQEVRVGTQKQIVHLLRKKRVDMAIMFDEVAKDTMTRMGLEHSSIKQGQVNHQSNIYVAFSKKSDTKAMMKLLDKGLKSLKASLENHPLNP
ncbi:amino acid ABC transporter substrate-binding protein [Colwellia demingiae]|uniref:Amino acid ABC transporter substrate-binding protein n=1 Tax=Colwellia demingiae TaxID=89401 RepID=A0A5C6Q5L7_9GAMM|nr:transporter substrate-binding domain-containing protein [Colwellia demingiae]TWX64102.1 amino acid ABC transporter substrate-binding protein [Colwellia demingiae]